MRKRPVIRFITLVIGCGLWSLSHAIPRFRFALSSVAASAGSATKNGKTTSPSPSAAAAKEKKKGVAGFDASMSIESIRDGMFNGGTNDKNGAAEEGERPRRRRRRRRTEKGKIEVKEKKERNGVDEYSGSRALRMMEFWRRSGDIYFGYKIAQARMNVMGRLIKDPKEREVKVQEWWDELHEKSSDKVLKLCLDLRGFYLKAGQFLGTRPDFMPIQYIKKLCTLQDNVPPIPEAHIRQVLEEELGRPVSEVFSFLNLTAPVGSASICQVHEGRLRENNEKVAVKIQYPNAERIMRSDLMNLRGLSSYLRKFELKFDLVSMIIELQKQISQEFDFNIEARSIRTVGPGLEKAVPAVTVPKPYLATRRLLVMSFLEGIPITRLEENQEKAKALIGLQAWKGRKGLGRDLLKKMADAWGYMLFSTDVLHSDPHPGNVLVMKGMRLGILDWGQTKRLDPEVRRRLAKLIVAMGEGNEEDINKQFYHMGIKTGKQDDPEDITRMVFSMFDTCFVENYCANPFAEDHGLRKNPVLSFPSDLCYVLRTVQIMRGMAKSLGVDFSLTKVMFDFSLTKEWAPLAKEMLKREEEQVLLKAKRSLI